MIPGPLSYRNLRETGPRPHFSGSQSGTKIEPDLRLGYQSFLLACGDCFEILQGRPRGGGYLTTIWHRSAAEGLKP